MLPDFTQFIGAADGHPRPAAGVDTGAAGGVAGQTLAAVTIPQADAHHWQLRRRPGGDCGTGGVGAAGNLRPTNVALRAGADGRMRHCLAEGTLAACAPQRARVLTQSIATSVSRRAVNVKRALSIYRGRGGGHTMSSMH